MEGIIDGEQETQDLKDISYEELDEENGQGNRAGSATEDEEQYTSNPTTDRPTDDEDTRQVSNPFDEVADTETKDWDDTSEFAERQAEAEASGELDEEEG